LSIQKDSFAQIAAAQHQQQPLHNINKKHLFETGGL
jgi:hypothetical protein